mmetsp:Transcript_6500/g.24160  ORF Transcript_6500/g.24160 Transcript_6500/m.24160 type:complete len:131 (-) Transcript_6500:3494-3886(-)
MARRGSEPRWKAPLLLVLLGYACKATAAGGAVLRAPSRELLQDGPALLPFVPGDDEPKGAPEAAAPDSGAEKDDGDQGGGLALVPPTEGFCAGLCGGASGFCFCDPVCTNFQGKLRMHPTVRGHRAMSTR